MYKIGREYFVRNFILYYISHASAAIVVQVCSKSLRYDSVTTET